MNTIRKRALLLFYFFILIQCKDDDSTNDFKEISPQATAVGTTGASVVGQVITGNYVFHSNGGSPEGDSIYKWYRADDEKGENRAEIPHQKSRTYELTKADISKYISFEVTPVNIIGSSGEAASSKYIGKIKGETETSNSEITLYKVKNGELADSFDYKVTGDLLPAQQNRAKHQEIWALVKKVIPPEYLKRLNEFMLFWGETDIVKALGYVSPTSKDLSTWRYAIAIDYANQSGEDELEHTVLHEFAHILTLNKDQVNAFIKPKECKTCYPDYPKDGFAWRGCSHEDSYINQFFQQFWEDIWSDDPDKLTGFFSDKYPSQFVTHYAGVSPSEDMAETYWNYVFESEIPQTPGTIAEEKVKYFERFREFEIIKAFERKNLINNSNRSTRKRSFLKRKGMRKIKRTIYGGCIRRH